MVNFNIQDGYSIQLIQKTFSTNLNWSQHINDDDFGRLPSQVLDNSYFFHNKSVLPKASSILLVPKVQLQHAGNYTCAPSNTQPTNINVHVLKGE